MSWALKAAETDATKRALATFGNSFGLALYDREQLHVKKRTQGTSGPSEAGPARRLANGTAPSASESSLSGLDPHPSPSLPARIDKSVPTISEQKRIRSKEHLRFVAQQPCLICGRAPSQAHHVRYAQPRGLSLKVSDEFTVPLCAIHHSENHATGDERKWWEERKIDPLACAKELWDRGLRIESQFG
jgi:hypothetical protein